MWYRNWAHGQRMWQAADLRYSTDLIWDMGVRKDWGLGHFEETWGNAEVGWTLLVAQSRHNKWSLWKQINSTRRHPLSVYGGNLKWVQDRSLRDIELLQKDWSFHSRIKLVTAKLSVNLEREQGIKIGSRQRKSLSSLHRPILLAAEHLKCDSSVQNTLELKHVVWGK